MTLASVPLQLPIIQAPMAGVQDSVLAAAVSNAGGLGSLPCALLTPERMRHELTWIAAQTTKPYNVNFFCHEEPTPAPALEVAWRATLDPYYRELGIDPGILPEGPARRPFNAEAARVLAEFAPQVVSFHFGLPTPDLLTLVKARGSTVLATATTVDEAKWLQAHGADAIIAQGLEAGGHRGHFLSDDLTVQRETFSLLVQIVRAVSVPVVAAGGIADRRGVRMALDLGAAAVQVGTAYLLAPEATTSPVHRAALTSDGTRQTAVTNLFSGRAARGIVNRLMRDLGPLRPDVPPFPLAALALAPLRARAEALGRDDFSPLWAGEQFKTCQRRPAGDITRELAFP